MGVTQADVARLAGVSQRTVSNVINNFPHVSAELAARVNDAVEQLGYSPSQAARSLRSGRSRVLQLVIPELDVPYFAELARGVVKHAEEQGFGVMIRQTLGDPRREQDALEGSAAEYAEGTILSAVGPVERLARQSATRPPLVLIGERSGAGVADHIGIDDVAAASAATTHLIAAGRRRIAFIGADPANSLRMAEMRHRGYRDALRAAGRSVDDALVVQTASYHRADGAAAMESLLRAGRAPDAVFCATDLLALGALRSVRRAGLAVPDDIAVIGFDGLEEGEYSAPALSTVAPDKQGIATMAVDTLLARIEARTQGAAQPQPRDIVIPFSLVVRESSGLAR
ncbi:MAG: LacI family DNA-binding transcriptional regulator [Propionibacteriaceae bacterium]|nr:LacI family DNA-binding transcriptional regulator [Propionibacteriaceae bacterium]